jgi:hypothetical protein
MTNYLIVTALYQYGELSYPEIRAMTGLDYSEITFRGIEASFGGLIDFDPSSQKWLYKGWS